MTGKHYFFNHHNGLVDLDDLRESKHIKNLKPVVLSSRPMKQIRGIIKFLNEQIEDTIVTSFTIGDFKRWVKETGFENKCLVDFVCGYNGGTIELEHL